MYPNEKNLLILLALLKAYDVRRIIVSPGMTNVAFASSVQADPFFEVFSCVDERSAAYMACGMAAETGEPVVLSCTGATASRNYYSGLTEAFYRKLPVLAVTSSQPSCRVGHNQPQLTNRDHEPVPDAVKLSVELPFVKDAEDEWACRIGACKALLALRDGGGGPVHINLITRYTQDRSVRALPDVQPIRRFLPGDTLPAMPEKGRVAVFVGSRPRWTEAETAAVERFCELYNGVVLTDHTGNYRGKYGVQAALVANQRQGAAACCSPDLLIQIGEISGAYLSLSPKAVWRVHPDGRVVDTFRKLQNVFAMEIETFFSAYTAGSSQSERRTPAYYETWQSEDEKLRDQIPDVPFSNLWIGLNAGSRLPENAAIHFSILNSLRCWNYCALPRSVSCYSNVGGFGIDGCLSSLIGASLAHPERLHFGVIGDLSFFYDMNALGNRHIGANVRVLLVNNGLGFEFKKYDCYPIAMGLGEKTNDYISAAGHFGDRSPDTVRHYAQDLGFRYLCAATKEEFLQQADIFFTSEPADRPILFEVFTDDAHENEAQHAVEHLAHGASSGLKGIARSVLDVDTQKKLSSIVHKIRK